jgi:hypothetical protein
MNKVGSDIPLKDVTPAEAMFLHILHGPHNGGKTFGENFEKIEVSGEALVRDKVPDKVEPAKAAVGKPGDANYVAAVPAKVISHKEGLRPRTGVEELRRLTLKYAGAKDKAGKPLLDTIFPDKFNPKLPEHFSDIKWTDLAGGPEQGVVNYATGSLAQTNL